LVNENTRVLDIGCSSGTLGAVLIAEKKCEVVGIDLDKGDVQLAKKKLTDAHVGNIEYDDLSHVGKFDFIIFSDVIEHLLNPVSVLMKVKDMLNENGAVLFSIPNMANMSTRLMLLDGHFTYAETGLLDKTHLHFYDRQEIERIFTEAGYQIDEFDYGNRYIPKKNIKERLANVGLTPDSIFFEINKRQEAITYQYIGKAEPTDNPKTLPKRDFVSPYVLSTEEQVQLIEENYSNEIARINEAHEIEIEDLLAEKAQILTSTSWRITKPIRLIGLLARIIRRRLGIVKLSIQKNPYLHIFDYIDLFKAKRLYGKNDELFSKIKKNHKTRLAVVLHLYYVEKWSEIYKKLNMLQKEMYFDLFVTLPVTKSDFVATIKRDCPEANVFVVPNRGRDVLPFISVAKHLSNLGYESVLKIHSKKSPHRQDGEEWFSAIINNLIPSDSVVLESLGKILSQKNTGIVGPKDQYISLLVNYNSNAYLLQRLLRKVISRDFGKHSKFKPEEYGFFAGTMFWARLDSVDPLLEAGYDSANFEAEKGPIDATNAHAIERALCVVPELNKADIYGINQVGIEKISYVTNNIPEWSDLHPKLRKRKPKTGS
jgi:2-polyprenyl-3-methyl-5-hydroxy-6-metoxy-1,4-benzoquinol methylase